MRNLKYHGELANISQIMAGINHELRRMEKKGSVTLRLVRLNKRLVEKTKNLIDKKFLEEINGS